MAQNTVQQYRHWFEYEQDSHRNVLASFETVPEAQRESPVFQKALDLMGHIVAARRMWLYRFGLTADRPAHLFPTGVSLDELKTDLEAMEQKWGDYFQGLSNHELGRLLKYKSLDAGWFQSLVADILTQLFGHSWYHRGQIATLVKAAGGQPAVTDYIFWSREPIPEPE
jgi:uncharacterized damage-inducible protein DinB